MSRRHDVQVKGITDAGLKARKMKKVAVLGGGLMGSGIATASALAGMDVIIKEVNDKFLQVRRPLDTAPCPADAHSMPAVPSYGGFSMHLTSRAGSSVEAVCTCKCMSCCLQRHLKPLQECCHAAHFFLASSLSA